MMTIYFNLNRSMTDELYNEPALEITAKILDIFPFGEEEAIMVNQSNFYPAGGGQPGDQGIIEGSQGKFTVRDTRRDSQMILHIGKRDGEITKGEEVRLRVDEPTRSYNSRNHSAGHLLSSVLEEVSPGCKPTRADHTTKPFVKYSGDITDKIPENFEELINKRIADDLPIAVESVAHEEAKKRCNFLPNRPNDNKPWRVSQIGELMCIACGGTHVLSTKDIGHVSIVQIKFKKGETKIKYEI
jgi:Ser-tRNA(Ala) deacylase AlaX